MAQEIRSYNPNLTDQQAIVIARLNNIADDKGIISSTNNGKLYENIANLPEEYLKKYNVKREDINAATDYAKALIYVGQNSNPSSFTHELFHVVSYLRPEESKQLSNAIRHTLADEDRRTNLELFIDGHREIWQKAGDNSSTSQIMDRLSEIAENASKWRVGIEEDLARLWEAYQGSSTSIRNNMPKELRNLFEKLSRYIRQVYTTLKDNVALDSEIAKAYDQLMGIEESNKEQSSKNNTTSASIRNGRPESSSDIQSANVSSDAEHGTDKTQVNNEDSEVAFQRKANNTIQFRYADSDKIYVINQDSFDRIFDNSAETYTPIEFNESNWKMLFGEDQVLESVLGKVKISEHQFQKFEAKHRGRFLGMLKPTLENPTFILNEGGSDTKNFIKVFNTENGRKWFYGVSIRREDLDVVISARPMHRKQVINKLNNSFLAYVASDIQKGVESELHQETTTAHINNNKVNSESVKLENERIRLKSIAKEAVEELNLRFQKAPEGASITSADGNTAIQKRNGTLVLSHTLEAEELLKIEEIGGMPMPSLGITNPELQSWLYGYGDVTLIGDKSLAERIIASGAVYDRDMWSPIVPEKAYKLNTTGLRGYFDELNDGMPTSDFGIPDMDRIPSYEAETARDLARYIGDRVAVYVAYAK